MTLRIVKIRTPLQLPKHAQTLTHPRDHVITRVSCSLHATTMVSPPPHQHYAPDSLPGTPRPQSPRPRSQSPRPRSQSPRPQSQPRPTSQPRRLPPRMQPQPMPQHKAARRRETPNASSDRSVCRSISHGKALSKSCVCVSIRCLNQRCTKMQLFFHPLLM